MPKKSERVFYRFAMPSKPQEEEHDGLEKKQPPTPSTAEAEKGKDQEFDEYQGEEHPAFESEASESQSQSESSESESDEPPTPKTPRRKNKRKEDPPSAKTAKTGKSMDIVDYESQSESQSPVRKKKNKKHKRSRSRRNRRSKSRRRRRLQRPSRSRRRDRRDRDRRRDRHDDEEHDEEQVQKGWNKNGGNKGYDQGKGKHNAWNGDFNDWNGGNGEYHEDYFGEVKGEQKGNTGMGNGGLGNGGLGGFGKGGQGMWSPPPQQSGKWNGGAGKDWNTNEVNGKGAGKASKKGQKEPVRGQNPTANYPDKLLIRISMKDNSDSLDGLSMEAVQAVVRINGCDVSCNIIKEQDYLSIDRSSFHLGGNSIVEIQNGALHCPFIGRGAGKVKISPVKAKLKRPNNKIDAADL
jgi:hypothetical protein